MVSRELRRQLRRRADAAAKRASAVAQCGRGAIAFDRWRGQGRRYREALRATKSDEARAAIGAWCDGRTAGRHGERLLGVLEYGCASQAASDQAGDRFGGRDEAGMEG